MRFTITQKLTCPSCEADFELSVSSPNPIDFKQPPHQKQLKCLLCGSTSNVRVIEKHHTLEDRAWVWNDLYGCFEKDKEL